MKIDSVWLAHTLTIGDATGDWFDAERFDIWSTDDGVWIKRKGTAHAKFVSWGWGVAIQPVAGDLPESPREQEERRKMTASKRKADDPGNPATKEP